MLNYQRVKLKNPEHQLNDFRAHRIWPRAWLPIGRFECCRTHLGCVGKSLYTQNTANNGYFALEMMVNHWTLASYIQADPFHPVGVNALEPACDSCVHAHLAPIPEVLTDIDSLTSGENLAKWIGHLDTGYWSSYSWRSIPNSSIGTTIQLSLAGNRVPSGAPRSHLWSSNIPCISYILI
jgi:hypothetical protein